MFRRYIVTAALFVFMMNVVTPTVVAGPPFTSVLSFKRIDADPKRAYELTDRNGPWMIYAASFDGETAKARAHELVIELRRDFKMTAYVFHQEFSLDRMIQGNGFDLEMNEGANPQLKPQKMKYLNNRRVDEYAVLVGDFNSADDDQLQKTLQSVKQIRPKCLTGDADTAHSRLNELTKKDTFSSLGLGSSKKDKEKNKMKGPLWTAFMTRNPLLPNEYFAPKGPDKLVLSMNRDLEYSLLKNKSRYTVRVARFTSTASISVGNADAGRNEKEPSEKLYQAAQRAHDVTLAMRKKGIEAYEFHDRNESIVTVGGFETIGDRTATGEFRISPAVGAVIKEFGATVNKVDPKYMEKKRSTKGSTVIAEAGGTAIVPKMYAGQALEVRPVPMEVPRTSIATQYVNR